MIEKVGHVKNPLTVIAVFAGLAEVSGTVVLPFIEPQTQGVYVWFLMGFPCLLVILFFITLLWRHHVLYAPSDFRSDESFTNIFTQVPNLTRAKKLEEEVQELEIAENNERLANERDVLIAPLLRRDIRAHSLLAEELVVAELAKEFQMTLERNIAFLSSPNLVFDALARKGDRMLAVEVKYLRKGAVQQELVDSTLARFSSAYENLERPAKQAFEAVFAVATDGDGAEKHSEIRNLITARAEKFPFKTEIRVFDLQDLEANIEREVGELGGGTVDSYSRRIIGLLGAGQSMSQKDLLSELGVRSDNQQAFAAVQIAIGDLIKTGIIKQNPAGGRYMLTNVMEKA